MAHYNLGAVYSESGKYEEAIKPYKRAIRINPDYSEAHYNLGFAYVKSGMYQEAIESFKQATGLDPDDAIVHYNLGLAYYESGKYEEAIKPYKRAIRIDPDFAIAHYNLGYTYVFLGDRDSALEQYEILKELDTELANKLFNAISGISEPTTNSQVYTKSTDSTGSLMSHLHGAWLIMLALLALGLAPPLLIRFLFVRRPIGKWWAIGTTVGFFIINIFLFVVLEVSLRSKLLIIQAYPASIFIAVVSYFILRKKLKHKSQSGKKSKERVIKTKAEAEFFPCPKCSQLNTSRRAICKNCGTVLGGYCPECKKPIRPGELFCSNCYPDGKTKTRGLRDEISAIRDGIVDRQDKALESWDKIKKESKSIAMERKLATLIKGDTQARVASIVGKPNSVENEDEDSGQVIWVYDCGSEGKRAITFNDGFIEKIEVRY